MEHFNQLSPSEAERLAILLEELGEAQQAIGKILRHGYESFHPRVPDITNRETLEKELGDVLFAIEMLCGSNDLNMGEIKEWAKQKSMRIEQYLHHQ